MAPLTTTSCEKQTGGIQMRKGTQHREAAPDSGPGHPASSGASSTIGRRRIRRLRSLGLAVSEPARARSPGRIRGSVRCRVDVRL